MERQTLNLLRAFDEALEFFLRQVAALKFVRGDFGLGGQHTHGQLLGTHLQREEADGAGLLAAVEGIAVFIGQGAGGVEGDVGGQCGFAHRRTTGEDQQVGRVQAAEHFVEVDQTGGNTHHVAGILKRLLGADQRIGNGEFEGLEPALGVAIGGEAEELLLGHLHLGDAGEFGLVVEGAVDGGFPHRDQPAFNSEIANNLRIVVNVDDRGGGGDEAGEILIFDPFLTDEMVLQRDGVGDESLIVELLDGLEDALVDDGIEILGDQRRSHMVQRLVIGQDGAQDGLLRLQVMRCLAVRRAHGRVLDGDNVVACCHVCLTIFVALLGCHHSNRKSTRHHASSSIHTHAAKRGPGRAGNVYN